MASRPTIRSWPDWPRATRWWRRWRRVRGPRRSGRHPRHSRSGAALRRRPRRAGHRFGAAGGTLVRRHDRGRDRRPLSRARQSPGAAGAPRAVERRGPGRRSVRGPRCRDAQPAVRRRTACPIGGHTGCARRRRDAGQPRARHDHGRALPVADPRPRPVAAAVPRARADTHRPRRARQVRSRGLRRRVWQGARVGPGRQDCRGWTHVDARGSGRGALSRSRCSWIGERMVGRRIREVPLLPPDAVAVSARRLPRSAITACGSTCRRRSCTTRCAGTRSTTSTSTSSSSPISRASTASASTSTTRTPTGSCRRRT